MQFLYNDKKYDIIISKKTSTKNTYLKVKKDLKIYVTTNYFTTNNFISNLIKDNEIKIKKMIDIQTNKITDKFLYLGKSYDIVYISNYDITFGESKVFLNKDFDINKWYKKKALKLFSEHLDLMYDNFSYTIPRPTLRIRKMTTRWGVCNTKTKVITLNLELIKRDIKYLDYVIVHELSHLIHPNHSKNFWSVVGENYPNYKKIRKEMKEF